MPAKDDAWAGSEAAAPAPSAQPPHEASEADPGVVGTISQGGHVSAPSQSFIDPGSSAPVNGSGSQHVNADATTSGEVRFRAVRGIRAWSDFATTHGGVIDQYFCTRAPAGAVLTSKDEIHLELTGAADERAQKIEDLLIRCDRLHIEVLAFLEGWQRRRLIRMIFSAAKQLLRQLDEPARNGQGRELRAVDAQIEEISRHFLRATQWHGQMEYFRGMVWTTTLLVLVVATGMAGMYSWTWWDGWCAGLESGSDPWQDCVQDEMMYRRYVTLAISAVVSLVISAIVILVIQFTLASVQVREAWRHDIRAVQEDTTTALSMIVQFLGLTVIVGPVMVLSAAVGFITGVENIQPILTSFLAGLMGASVSVMWRMSSGKLLVDYEAPRSTLRFLGGFRPIIGSVFGLLMVVLLSAGLINLSKFNTTDGVNLYLYFALAFVAGFSERLAPDMLDDATRRFGRPEQQSPMASQATRGADRP